jgi:protocatechuate 3,4-dioxygenase beta subunit
MRALFILMLAAAPLAAQTATVEGKVTEMGSGRPVRNAEVVLRGLTQTGNPPEADNYATEADANGHFLIEGIAPGKYQAAPSHAGFITRPPGKPMQPGTFAQVTLAAGQHATVDLKLIVTGAISGRAITLTGDVVTGAWVEALQYAYPSRDDSPSGTVTVGLPTDGHKQLESRGGAVTNDRGEFRIFGLAPGQYYLRIQEMIRQDLLLECTSDQAVAATLHGIMRTVNEFEGLSDGSIQCSAPEHIRGSRPLGFGQTFYPGARAFSEATPLDVTPGGDLRSVDIRLRPEGVYSIRLTKPALPGDSAFPVEIRRRGDSGQPNVSMSFHEDYIEIPGLLPGSYTVSGQLQDPEHPDQSIYARQLVEVVDHDVEGVTLNFAPMKTVTGTIKAEGPLTVPFSGMNVELDPDDPDTPAFTTRVKADGTFTAQVMPEPYVLMRPRIATAYVKSVKMGDRELPGPHIDFARLDGPLTMLFGVDAGSVDGTALTADGQPMMPSKITLIPVGSNQSWAGRLKIVNADENGKFVIPVVAPGEYKAFAWLDADLGAPQDPEFRKPYESRGVTVKVEPNGRSSVQLKLIVTDK